jgi:signal transduction histidine kinase
VSSSRPLIEEREQTLEVQLPAESIVIDCDRVRLVQVVTNPLNNAARCSPPNGKIDVRCERVNDGVELSVEDNGRGIPQELLPHLAPASQRWTPTALTERC